MIRAKFKGIGSKEFIFAPKNSNAQHINSDRKSCVGSRLGVLIVLEFFGFHRFDSFPLDSAVASSSLSPTSPESVESESYGDIGGEITECSRASL